MRLPFADANGRSPAQLGYPVAIGERPLSGSDDDLGNG